MVAAGRGGCFDSLKRFDSAFADFRIARLHSQYPAYLCRPNLAWQSRHSDDSDQLKAYSNYYANGAVRVGQGD